jgi:SAM-dependent methyltransferase
MSRAGKWRKQYMERWYSRDRGWIDGTTRFHGICRQAVDPETNPTLLEIGAGPSNVSSAFFSTLGTLVGVDLDPAVKLNDALARSEVVDTEALPFDEATFDACFSNWVLEHLQDPTAHLTEVARVLKPGGHYVARTPNRFHYVTLVAAATPHSFHKLVANRLRALPGKAHEPWPTYYRMNSERAVRKAAASSGLRICAIHMLESEPSYGFAARPLFLLFMGYERFVNFTPRLSRLRHTMIIDLGKDADAGS